MRSRAIKSVVRKAVVAASILILAIIVGVVLFVLRQSEAKAKAAAHPRFGGEPAGDARRSRPVADQPGFPRFPRFDEARRAPPRR